KFDAAEAAYDDAMAKIGNAASDADAINLRRKVASFYGNPQVNAFFGKAVASAAATTNPATTNPAAPNLKYDKAIAILQPVAGDVVDEAHGIGAPRLQIPTRLALADAYRAHGQVDSAIQEIEVCLSREPGNKETRIKLIETMGTLASPRWSQVEQLINDAK